MNDRHRSISSARRGQAMVELALLAPLLLGLLLGILDTGLMLNTKNAVAYANRQAVQLLETNSTDSTILQTITTTLLAGGLAVRDLQSVTIYRANQSDTQADTQNGANPAMQIAYTFSNGVPSAPTGSYTITARTGNDYAGIAIHYLYHGLTPLFNRGFPLGDTLNVRLDPPGNIYTIPTPLVPTSLPTATPPTGPTPAPTYTPRPTYTSLPSSTPTGIVATPTPGILSSVALTSTVISVGQSTGLSATVLTNYALTNASILFVVSDPSHGLFNVITATTPASFSPTIAQTFTAIYANPSGASCPVASAATATSVSAATVTPTAATPTPSLSCSAQVTAVVLSSSGAVLATSPPALLYYNVSGAP